MKPLFKKNPPQNVTNYNPSRALNLEHDKKDSSMDGLLVQRIGKSRQEIFDLMKILKTF
jgi:hypothetical protein